MTTQVKEIAQMVGAIVGSLIAIGGAYAALGLPRPIFHTTLTETIDGVEKKFDGRVKDLEKHAGDTRGRVIDLQLQSNRQERDALRSEKLTRGLEVRKPEYEASRQIIQQRLDQIDERLESVETERKRLMEEKQKP